jgi:isopenicillin N synthase-like dioxygenase
MSIVPVIDIGREPAVVAPELDAVCRDVGFFQITGHGVPAATIDAAWAATWQFFGLPAEVKLAAERPYAGYPYGYVPIAGETLSRSLGNEAAPDLKEIFNVGPVDAPRHRLVDPDEELLFGATPWPADLPQLRPALEAYFRAMDSLARRMMSLFALALGLEQQHFAADIDDAAGALRTLNYPEQTVPPAPGQLRAGAHTDYGTLTILRQDDAPGGLEVRDPHAPDERWVPITSVPDAFVINVGDMLAQWTNDRWRSTLHRVVNPPAQAGVRSRRQSIAFFHNADFDCRVACLPTCTGPDNPPRYAPVLAGPHLVAKFRSTTPD